MVVLYGRCTILGNCTRCCAETWGYRLMGQPFTGTQANADGYSLPVTSQTIGAMIAAPFSVCFVDKDGNEYSTSGATVGAYRQAPLPVVLCNSLGQPITPPITI